MKTKTSAPAVYVGTWAKYNNGSIEGCWFNDLTVFETESDFLAAARKFHQDEKDPEFMYQDYENFPSGMASEYGFNWAYVEGYRLSREEGCEDAWYAWGSNTGDTCFEQFRGAWLGGPYDSELEFAAQYVDECGFLSEVPDTVARYFDYEAFARDLFMELDFVDGHVFHR
ncbi:TPA: antirestriction protein ArdA [Escherichia coli]|uniref:antirestriction protein ArdA n=1 Tax=Escherichia coli TaxID=562 RepID=UPI001C190578|nr:antirestriction protein ArdA [Escherichia coli]HBE5054988.1 antirestriction protein ArdA [Escherichia coli]